MNEELAPTGNGRWLRQRVQLERAHELEQRAVLGAYAAELHTLRIELAQEKRSNRVAPGQLCIVDCTWLAVRESILDLWQSTGIEHVFQGALVDLFSDCDFGTRALS